MWHRMCYSIGTYRVTQYNSKTTGSNHFNKRKGEKICTFVHTLITLGRDPKSDPPWLMAFDLF